jgi:hypothetical protein
MPHNIDLHAVHGPGGGGSATEGAPGETKAFTFKALTEGLYVYHCAVPMASNHISNGMYGLILVEPAGGLPKVDREFYVMQGELYTTGAYGQSGAQEFSYDKLMDEHPEYFVLNGAVGALTKEHPLLAKTGETIRVYFGVIAPNLIPPDSRSQSHSDQSFDDRTSIKLPIDRRQKETLRNQYSYLPAIAFDRHSPDGRRSGAYPASICPLGQGRYFFEGEKRAPRYGEQEVQKVMPKAVVRDRDGYLKALYEKLGLKFETYDHWIASGAWVPTIP